MSWLSIIAIICLVCTEAFIFLASGAEDDPDEEREGDDE